jgi:hypothetical protein
MILIPVAVAVAWLGVLSLCLSICVMAARGDAAYERASEEAPPVEREAAAAAAAIPSPRHADATLRLRRVRRASPRTLTGRAVR